jgi:hypothetical protein
VFHPEVVDRRIRILERQFGVRLYRYTRDESIHVSAIELEHKRDPKTNQLTNLTQDEQLFIQNEILMSRADFRYWFERYPKLVLDDATGELGHPRVWRSQDIMLNRMAERELDMWQKWEGGHRRLDGNRWYVHKARQMGLSSICQGINAHAVNFYSNTACLVGSKNLPKTQQVWRDYGRLMWSTMPDWMKVPAIQDHGERGMVLSNGSKVVLQHSEQESGFGQGAKWHRAHLTEIADWNPNVVSNHIDNHFDPAVSRSIKSAAFLESTSQGMDNYWHKNTERARAKRLNWWWYLFIPWWVIPELYIEETIPEGWEPQPETKQEEELIIANSPEWNEGRTYRPPVKQMLWWERQRTTYQTKGELGEFYKNYPSIPEQSFTHSGRSSFTYEILSWCDAKVRDPIAYYDVVDNNTPSELIRTAPERDRNGKMVDPPPIFTVADISIAPVYVTDEERLDPLGLISVWEMPRDVAPMDVYGGVDTTGGVEGWSRHLRRKDDADINNACISMIRSGMTMDTDVLEYAAPVTAQPLARIYNVLARTWLGRNHTDGQVPTIVELTGEGLAFQEELITRYDFFAFYQHYEFTGADWKETSKFGWTSTPKSIRYLWTLFKSHVTSQLYIPRSRNLVREMRSCTDDQIYVGGMTRGKAPKSGGRHDDRVYSRAFALWFANSWANPDAKPFRQPTPKVETKGIGRKKLHQMDFDSPEEREAYLAEWDAGLSGNRGW